MCNHSNSKIIQIENSAHNAKLVCSDCNKWLKWISTKSQDELNAQKMKGEYYALRRYQMNMKLPKE